MFTRGATEAINLVAHRWPHRRRRAAVQLEHHSNIVPWQLAGWQVDVCPLTARRPDRPRCGRAMLTPDHKMVALRACLERARLGARCAAGGGPRACRSAPSCCSTAARQCRAWRSMSPRSAAISTCSPATSSTGRPGSARCGRGRAARRDAAMAGRRGDDRRASLSRAPLTPLPPQRFEAGTPAIVEAIGLAAAIDYVDGIGLEAIHAHETAAGRSDCAMRCAA